MYFDEFKKKCVALKTSLEKRYKQLSDEYQAIASKGIELAAMQDSAAAKGDHDGYIKLIGELAINKRKLEDLRESLKDNDHDDEFLDIADAVNHAFEIEISKKVAAADGIIANLLKTIEEMTAISDEYESVYSDLTGMTQKCASKRMSDPAYIYRFQRYADIVVDPYCDVPSTKSLKGWLNEFRY